MIIVAIVGILAVVAVPTFMDYIVRSKKTEAALQLDKISKNSKRVYSETSSFVVGFAGELPNKVATGCCQGGGTDPNHCKADPASWASEPTWSALEFQIDEDNLFIYDYNSTDGKTFLAQATGDLDCDGNEITYTLNGTTDRGNPVATLTEPSNPD